MNRHVYEISENFYIFKLKEIFFCYILRYILNNNNNVLLLLFKKVDVVNEGRLNFVETSKSAAYTTRDPLCPCAVVHSLLDGANERASKFSPDVIYGMPFNRARLAEKIAPRRNKSVFLALACRRRQRLGIKASIYFVPLDTYYSEYYKGGKKHYILICFIFFFFPTEK